MQPHSIEESLQRAHQLYGQRQFAECERICRKILQQEPEQAEALSLLGYLAMQGGLPELAAECFERASTLQPEHAGHQGALSSALRQAGRHQEALLAQANCVALAPGDVEARQNLALQTAEAGELQRAREIYEDVLGRAPALGQAHYGLSLIKKFQRDDPHIEQMLGLLDGGELEPQDQVRLAFSLGKAFDDLGDYDRAFEYYARGNRQKKATLQFDITREQSNTERLLQAFAPGLPATLRGVGYGSERPVFIVGMPRSGSTLVEQIIANHPAVHGAGELPNLARSIERGLHGMVPPGSEFPELVGDVPRDGWAALGEAYDESVARLAPGAQRIIDKQVFNYTLVGMVHLMLPNARIIHCSRDPMDTCLSCFTQNFGAERGFTCDLGDLGKTYRLYQKVMAHWRAWLPTPMLEVVYEELVENPEAEARRLIEFLGLEWTDDCLAHERNPRAVVTSSLGQVRAPVYTSSVGRWRRFESHLQALEQALSDDV